MTPEEAQKLVDFARTKSPSQVRLRVVSSIDNPEADGAGAKLQQRRREMGLSVVQVAQALKLRPDQIAAIESMQFSRLPGLGYALGYVKAYAELLDFADIKAIVDDYKEAWSPEQKRAEENDEDQGYRSGTTQRRSQVRNDEKTPHTNLRSFHLCR